MLILDFYVCRHALPAPPPVPLHMHRNGKFRFLTGFGQQILKKNGWLIGKEGRGHKVPCSHLYHLLCPCLCHSFPHFGRNNSHIYSWVILELFPLPHPHSLVFFLPLLIHFLESIHTRGASSTSLWLQTRFLWRKSSLKPCSSTKVVFESQPEGGLHHQPVFQCAANTFISES